MIDTVISQYKILGEIGRGGMGIVYKAEDIRLGRFVVLKFLPPYLTFDPDAKARFVNEARAASAIDHPNICTIHSIDEAADGQLFICMAYYEGESLKQRLANGALPITTSVNIASQIASGLENAHSRGIIHRDIKPGNIIVTNNGVVKIIDFGLSKLQHQKGQTRTTTTLGTVAYMSPERLQNLPVDHRTDIWSLGVIFYEMLTGELPFKGDFDQAVMYSIVNDEPKLIENTREGIRNAHRHVIRTALQKKSEDRYQDARHLISDLEMLKNGHYQLVEQRAAHTKMKRILSLLALAGIMIAILIALFWAELWRPSADNPQQSAIPIAVLPFENLLGSPEEEWIPAGLTDFLTTELSKINGFSVIAENSVQQFSTSEYSLNEIAERLAVRYLIDGSAIRISGDIRITIRLIDSTSGLNLWAGSYDTDSSHAFQHVPKMIGSIANELGVHLETQEARSLAALRQVDPKAKEFYSRGRLHLSKRNDENISKAIEYFEKAIAIDSLYALPYAGLSETYLFINFAYSARPQMDALSLADSYAERAMRIDSTVAEAHATTAFVSMMRDLDWKGAERKFKRAIRLNPNSVKAYEWYAWLLLFNERFDESRRMLKRAATLEPASPAIQTELGWILYFEGKFREAIDQYRLALEFEPNFSLAHFNAGLAYHYLGEYDNAIASFEKAIAISDAAHWKQGLGLSYAKMGDTTKAVAILNEFLTLYSQGYKVEEDIAALHIVLGDFDAAFEWIHKGLESGPANYIGARIVYNLDPIRSDPRFEAVLRHLNFEK